MKRFLAVLFLALALSAVSFAQGTPGLWYLSTSQAIEKAGMVEGDSFVLARPVDNLPAGSYVQFCASLENGGEKAPRHYMVEFFDGGRWVADPEFVYDDGQAEYSFFTVSSSVRHPSTYLSVYKLRNAVSDTLKVRLRVCSPFATDGSRLSADEPQNKVALKNKHYVGAYLNPLGTKAPRETASLLLIGNSFTYYFGEPFMLQEIAFSQGLRLNVKASLKGGQTFRDHCGREMTLRTVSGGEYDYAVIQGQSQEPARYAADRSGQVDVENAFVELCRKIRETSPDCNIFVENTWGYPGSDNGGFSSLDEFDRLLEEGSWLLAEAGVGDKIPVGKAFTAARERTELLESDAKHPGLAGAYLKACITCLVLTGRPFSGDVPKCGLPDEEAAYLRSIAEKTVLK
ncbi:MAG: hypothetical protein IJU68_02605 [Bacteroidales bacterium]|nr:hypothetical protein [Bacteroidales bacterium]